jgi:hypothetical protein
MSQLDQTTLNQIVAAVLQALGNTGTASPKAPAISAPADRLAQKDRALIAGFRRKGIPLDQIKLMDRSNPQAEFNVRPYGEWQRNGRQVRKAETSVKGLFHVSQTDPIAQPKPAPKGKAKLVTKLMPVKPQPTLV